MTGRRLGIDEMCVAPFATLRVAAEQMNTNRLGVVFVLDGQRLVGVVSDGDFRRFMLRGDPNLEVPVSSIMNTSPWTLPIGAGAEETYAALAAGIKAGRKVFPRVDENLIVGGFSYSDHWGLMPIAEPELTGNEAAYVLQCVEQNWISSSGPFVPDFEKSFAKFTGLRHGVAVSNGTVALTLALQALGLEANGEVIVPSTTFAATANAVVAAGGVPVIADVDPVTWGLSPKTVEPLINTRTWGMIPVHLYGSPCDVLGLRQLADCHNLIMIEDCAEAIGTLLPSGHVGGIGEASTFSFFGNKTLTTGEGGMVMLSDPETERLARRLRDHGMSATRRYWHEVVGYNYRLTNLQAAIGVAQVERAGYLVGKKRHIGEMYALGLRTIQGISMMPQSPFGESSFWLIACLLDEHLAGRKDLLMELLAAEGIQARAIFPALHRMPAFNEYPRADCLRVSEDLENRGICFPNTPRMTEENVAHIMRSIAHNIGVIASMPDKELVAQ